MIKESRHNTMPKEQLQKVSILMPVYNTKEEYLREAIESILNQTYTNFEFLILDDCPETPVKTVVDSYQDERIKYHKNATNMGISETSNRLIDLANCELMFMCDHDDISLPSRVEKQVDFLEKHPEVGVVGCWYKCFPKIREVNHPEAHEEIEKKLLFGMCVIANPCAAIRKSVILNNGLKYESEYNSNQDYRMWTNLIGKTKFANLPEILFNYRWHSGNFSKSNNYRQPFLAQKVMFLTQAKYFGLDFTQVIAVFDKLLQNKKILTNELKVLLKAFFELKERAKDYGLTDIINRDTYKLLLRRTKKDVEYLKILWRDDLAKELSIKIWFKLENTIRV